MVEIEFTTHPAIDQKTYLNEKKNKIRPEYSAHDLLSYPSSFCHTQFLTHLYIFLTFSVTSTFPFVLLCYMVHRLL